MLFEAMTGEGPFPGRDLELPRQKQTQEPPRLSNDATLPETLHDLAEPADGLLQKEPRGRLDARAILEHLRLDVESTHQPSATQTGGISSHHGEEDWETHRAPEKEALLIGREEQLEQLEEARQRMLEFRKPLVAWITGLSGVGKSSLAEAFMRSLRQDREMLVLSGRCYDRESVPFKATDSFIESLVSYLRSSEGKQQCW